MERRQEVEENSIANAAFLRAEIENIDKFFAPAEVEEIWITFPDPQMQKARKRLTSTRFLTMYGKFLKPGGIINLKTDSPFLLNIHGVLPNSTGLKLLLLQTTYMGAGWPTR